MSEERHSIAPAMDVRVIDFFARSDSLDYLVLRPLSHIAPNWEATWDHGERRYEPESHSFADDLNRLIKDLAKTPSPRRYHESEDVLVENVVRKLKWPLQKKGSRWIVTDYAWLLEQGGFADINQRHLRSAASGRLHAALQRNQDHFDRMEEAHRHMLSALLSIILYHRECRGDSSLHGEHAGDRNFRSSLRAAVGLVRMVANSAYCESPIAWIHATRAGMTRTGSPPYQRDDVASRSFDRPRYPGLQNYPLKVISPSDFTVKDLI